MSVSGKKRLPSIIEAVVANKASVKPVTKDTFRSDAAAILESLTGEFDEDIIVAAMDKQGFDGAAYRSSIRALARIAHERRQLRSDYSRQVKE